jgi:hypothetical protein
MAKTESTVGRRTKLTPKVQEKIVSAIRAGNYAHVAAGYAGIGERTFYSWLQSGRENKSDLYQQFLQAVKDAEREAEVRAVAMVQKHMADNWQAAMTYLERKFPERWGRRDRLKIEVEPQKVLTTLLGLDGDDIYSVVDTAARLGGLDDPAD